MSRERAKEVYELYKQLGSYKNVGNYLDLTRQRVEQILKNGNERGYIEFIPLHSERRNRAKIALENNLDSLLKDSESLLDLAKKVCLSTEELRDLCLRSNIDLDRIKDKIRLNVQQKRIDRSTKALKKALEETNYFDVSSTFFQRYKSEYVRYHYMYLTRILGGIKNLRAHLGVPSESTKRRIPRKEYIPKSYECHVTFHCKYKEEVKKACEKDTFWKASWIDGDPVLGDKVFVYASAHGNSSRYLYGKMNIFCSYFPPEYIIRKKIEKIIYDTKVK